MLHNNRVGSGFGFVFNLLTAQKRGAICLFYTTNRLVWVVVLFSIVLCYKRTGDGGRRVVRKGLDSGRDRTAGCLILMKGFSSSKERVIILVQKQCLLRVH